MRRHKLNILCVVLCIGLLIAGVVALVMLKAGGMVGH